MDYIPLGVSDLSGALALVVRRRVMAGVLTGRGLAMRCGLSQSFICNWLHGRVALSAASCDAVLRALRLTAAEVLDGGVPTPRPWRAPVLVMPRAGDPRRGPAVAARPRWAGRLVGLVDLAKAVRRRSGRHADYGALA